MTDSSQLKIGVTLSYLSTGINMLIQLLYTPLMIRLLGQSEYGLYTLVGSFVSYLSLFSLGFTSSYLRFYSMLKAKNDRDGIAQLNGMFLTVFGVMSLVAMTSGMILAQFPQQIFGDKLTALEQQTAQILMRILVVNIALTFPSGLLDSIISAHEKFLFQRLISLIGVLCNPLLALPLLLMGFGSVAVVSVTTSITISKLFVNLIYCFKVLHIEFNFARFDFGILCEIGKFSFFLFLGMIIDQINWSVDKVILGRVSGTVAVAVYGVGAQINALVLNFSTAISSVFVPRVNRIAAEEKENATGHFTQLMIRVGRIQYLVLMLIVLGFVVFGRYFITNIYATIDYEEAYFVALLLIVPAVVSLIQNLGIEIQRAVNKHQFRALIYLFMSLVNIFVSIPLARAFGPTGSALGTAISLIIANGIIMNIYYQCRIGLDMIAFWKSIISLSKGLFVPVLVGALFMRFAFYDSIFKYAIYIIFYVIVYTLSMWNVGMNSEEKQLIIQVLNKFGFFLRTKGR